jgi:hypothetical protein
MKTSGGISYRIGGLSCTRIMGQLLAKTFGADDLSVERYQSICAARLRYETRNAGPMDTKQPGNFGPGLIATLYHFNGLSSLMGGQLWQPTADRPREEATSTRLW